MIKLQDAEDRAAAAGEYVLGTLSPDDQEAVRQALAHDPALQADVHAWQDRLLSLTTHAAPMAPRPQLWQRIDASLNAMASAATARLRPSPTVERTPWWQRLGWWQGLSGLALAACLVMAVLLVERGVGIAPAGAHYVAVLQSPKDQSAGWLVEVQSGGTLRLKPVADTGVVPAGRSLQFWTKPKGAPGPSFTWGAPSRCDEWGALRRSPAWGPRSSTT
ncbi:MAG: RNA polymerase subunit sigma-70 [Rubrivivax sp.]|nr:MAG: RNA polymerase subunit sigma-70 [Rubrivivax sp.]